MNMAHVCWEENSNIQRMKYERCNTVEEPVRMKDDRGGLYQCCDSNLNFSTATCSEDDCEYGTYKKSKVVRQDPMSHRIIEKRRRDRMNNCLADLSRLIPTEYLKKGRGRIEKTEIIEMAIKHMKHLQTQDRGNPVEHYRLGYQECMSEAMRFMVEIEGHFPREPLCIRLLNHLQNHGEQVAQSGMAFAGSPSGPVFPTSQIPRAAPSPRPPPCDFTVPKTEPENSNSSDAFAARPDRDSVCNAAASYKYKTSIKLRFSQDASAHEVPKRKRLDNGTGNTVAPVFDSQSSNQSPPRIADQSSQSPESEHPESRPSSDCASPTRTHQVRHSTTTVQRIASLPLPTNTADNFDVPVFVLHAKSSYYVPVTVDYKTLLPYMQSYDLLDAIPATVLHPVTINVNFLPHLKSSRYKYECNNNWH